MIGAAIAFLAQFGPAIGIAMAGAAVAALAARAAGLGQHGLAGIALGVGYFAGYCFVAGWPGFPPAEATRWLPWFSLAGAALGVVDAARKWRGWLRLAAWTVVCAVALALFLQPKFRHAWTAAEGACWLAGLVLIAAALAWRADASARGERRWIFAAVPAIASGATSAALALSGSLLMAQLAGLLCGIAALAVAASFGKWPAAWEARSCVPGVVLLLAALLAGGVFYSGLPAWSAALLALTLAGGTLPAGGAARLSCALGFSAAAVAVAAHLSPPLLY